MTNIKGRVFSPDVIHGKSAYEIAKEHGFEGTEEEWLAYIAPFENGDGDASLVQKVAEGEVPNTATGRGSAAFGEGSQSLANKAATFGTNGVNRSHSGIVFGQNCETDENATAALCGGYGCKVTKPYGTSLGRETETSGMYGFGNGRNVKVSGDGAFGAGAGHDISGTHAGGIGNNLIVKALDSFSAGVSNVIEEGGSGSMTLGEYLLSRYRAQLIAGTANENKPDTVVEIGNGWIEGNTPKIRSNAFEVYRDGHSESGRSTTDEDGDKTLVTKDYMLANIGTKLYLHTLAFNQTFTSSEGEPFNKSYLFAITTSAEPCRPMVSADGYIGSAITEFNSLGLYFPNSIIIALFGGFTEVGLEHYNELRLPVEAVCGYNVSANSNGTYLGQAVMNEATVVGDGGTTSKVIFEQANFIGDTVTEI